LPAVVRHAVIARDAAVNAEHKCKTPRDLQRAPRAPAVDALARGATQSAPL